MSKIEKDKENNEICFQCKKEFHGAKYLDKEKEMWLCQKCYFEDEQIVG